MNNEIHKLYIEENIEIEKILHELTLLFVPYLDNLENDVNIISKLDLIFAKASYSKKLGCNIPKISNDKVIFLKNAKHPLLPKESAVPITLTLGKDFSTLLITGPNTGGKTVTLKTVGLLLCMAYSRTCNSL